MKVFKLLAVGFFFCFGCSNQEPDLSNRNQFQLENIRFLYPGNWYVGKSGEDKSIGFKWTNIKSPDNFVYGIQHYNKTFEYDIDILADNYIKAVKEKMKKYTIDAELGNNRKHIAIEIMGKKVRGVQFDYIDRILGVNIHQRTVLFQYVTKNSTSIFTATTNLDDWKREDDGFRLINKTLQIE